MSLNDNQIHDLIMLWLNKGNYPFSSIDELLKEYETLQSEVRDYLPSLSKQVKAGNFRL